MEWHYLVQEIIQMYWHHFWHENGRILMIIIFIRNIFSCIKNHKYESVCLILDQVNLHRQARALYRKVDGTLRIRYAFRMGFDIVSDTEQI